MSRDHEYTITVRAILPPYQGDNPIQIVIGNIPDDPGYIPLVLEYPHNLQTISREGEGDG